MSPFCEAGPLRCGIASGDADLTAYVKIRFRIQAAVRRCDMCAPNNPEAPVTMVKRTDGPFSLPRPSRRQFLAGSSMLALTLAFAGTAPLEAFAQTSAPKRGGSLKVAVPAATSIDPVKLNSSGGIAIVQQAAEYLVYAEPDLTLRPVLATSWEPSEGGKVWTFALRQGVKFHDGRPMTADDVVASFQRL